MSAVLLNPEELSFDAFYEYHLCLERRLGRAYASFILGEPQEIRIVMPSKEDRKRSLLECSCVSCHGSIEAGDKEDCAFECDGEEDEGYFFVCRACQ